MALTSQAEVVSAALSLIGESAVTAGDLSANTLTSAIVANQHYDPTLDEVLLDTFWKFAHKFIALTLADPQPLYIPNSDDFANAFILPPDFLRPIKLADSADFELYSHFATIADGANDGTSSGTIFTSTAHGLSAGEFVYLAAGDQEGEIREVITVTDANNVVLAEPFTVDQTTAVAWKRATGEKLYLVTADSEAKLEYVARVTDPVKWQSLFAQAFILRLASKFAMAIAHSRSLSESYLQEYSVILDRAVTISGQSANRPTKFEDNILINVRRGSTSRPDKVINT